MTRNSRNAIIVDGLPTENNQHLRKKMTDYTKPFPCGECGQMIVATEKHTIKDCQKYKQLQEVIPK